MQELMVAEKKYQVIELPGRPKAILDRHIAEIYEVETKHVNQAVSRNPEKFPQDFCFDLTPEEAKTLSEVTNCDFDWKGGHLPKAFTPEGCNMLATILKSTIATQRAIQIVRGFTRLEQVYQAVKFGSDDELLAHALVVAQKKLQTIAQERDRLQIETDCTYKKIGYLQCQKDIRATEAQVQEAPRRVLEHYCLPDYKVAHALIYKEWKVRVGYDLRRKWTEERKSEKVTLTEFLMRNRLVEKYLQVVQSLIENSSKGSQQSYRMAQGDML